MSTSFKQYKGYTGSIAACLESGCLHGSIQGINSLITYEADTLPNLEKEFHASVDEYLEMCKEFGREPETPFASNILLRINPELHQALSFEAKKQSKSKNAFISEAIEEKIERGNDKKALRREIYLRLEETARETWDESVMPFGKPSSPAPKALYGGSIRWQ